MERQLLKHIEYLLTTHNCVIIPELGSFIINMEPARYNSEGILSPPFYSVIFNQDLKHNDGLLASEIQRNENISYDAACKKIKQTVLEMKRILLQGNNIECGILGILSSNEHNNLRFKSNPKYINPALYGLSYVNLRHLIHIENPFIESTETSKPRFNIAKIAAAAAIALLFIIPAINIGEYSSISDRQKASLLPAIPSLSTALSTHSNSFAIEAAENSSITSNGRDKEQNSDLNNSENEDTPYPKALSNATRTYYIVVAGEDTKTKTNTLLKKIKRTYFPEAEIVESQKRHRIYVASFDKKNEAENFLIEFRKDNPKYKAAWLYSKKNS